VKQVKEIVEEVRQELRRNEEPAGDGMKLGIMIEIRPPPWCRTCWPRTSISSASATNDLIAYSVAVDRANGRVAGLYQPAHPAVLRLLKTIIDAGAKAGKSVSSARDVERHQLHAAPAGARLRNFSVVPFIIPRPEEADPLGLAQGAQAIAVKALTFDVLRGLPRVPEGGNPALSARHRVGESREESSRAGLQLRSNPS